VTWLTSVSYKLYFYFSLLYLNWCQSNHYFIIKNKDSHQLIFLNNTAYSHYQFKYFLNIELKEHIKTYHLLEKNAVSILQLFFVLNLIAWRLWIFSIICLEKVQNQPNLQNRRFCQFLRVFISLSIWFSIHTAERFLCLSERSLVRFPVE
jgi:hypothetical protein